MASYENKDPMALAKEAERDLNSDAAKHGHGKGDSTNESGVDTSVEDKFPGAKVTYGSAASGAGDNREIPVEEGGDVFKNGRYVSLPARFPMELIPGIETTKARDFEGEGGPEDKIARAREDRGGDDDVDAPVRQGGVRDGAVRTG